jgi:hypothetical protein
LESKVLPLYDKYNQNYYLESYKELSQMYLNLKRYDKVKNLFKKMKQDKSITPKQMYSKDYLINLNSVLEAGIKTYDYDLINDCLKEIIMLKAYPPNRLLKEIGEIVNMPDRLLMLLKTHFRFSGKTNKRST